MGGNRINYPEEVATATAVMMVAKILSNSVISTPGARFMTLDISNFYLMTPLKQPEIYQSQIRWHAGQNHRWIQLTGQNKRQRIHIHGVHKGHVWSPTGRFIGEWTSWRKTQQTCICPEQIHTRTVETQNKTYTIFPGRRRLWRKIYLTRTCRAFKTGPRRTLQSHHRLDGHKHENMVRQENLVFESQRYLNIK